MKPPKPIGRPSKTGLSVKHMGRIKYDRASHFQNHKRYLELFPDGFKKVKP